MPGGDGTGPLGQGPVMGRSRNNSNDNFKRRGRGRGLGMRCRNVDTTGAATADMSHIQESLDQIDTRLTRLENEAETE